jgi:hypothetical protein
MNSFKNTKLIKLLDVKFYKSLPKRLAWFIEHTYHKEVFLKLASKESIFTAIWEKNYWGNKESVSGDGSTLEYTANLRKELPILFNKFSIKSIFDAPCGDLTWMQEILKNNDIKYCGGDIVKGIIEKNKTLSIQNTSFIIFDLTTQDFPEADLWLCRDLLFHLSNHDILKVLKQFEKSNIPFFLTTTHINSHHFKNQDILTGYFRFIDIFQEPFNFSQSPLYRFDDFIAPHPPREMCLFSREQVLEMIPILERNINTNV